MDKATDGCDHDTHTDWHLHLRHGLLAAIEHCDTCGAILNAHNLGHYQPKPRERQPPR